MKAVAYLFGIFSFGHFGTSVFTVCLLIKLFLICCIRLLIALFLKQAKRGFARSMRVCTNFYWYITNFGGN